jgi:hypothetical protein
MFSKQETAQLRKEFWTVFGQYMSPVLSAEGEKINWINYKTGVKGVQFKMDAGRNKASIAIEIVHPNQLIHQNLFNQLVSLKKSLHNSLKEEWTWLFFSEDEHGKILSRIYKETEVSILQKNEWPALISFFKTRIIALDEFWSNVKYDFEGRQ